MQNLLIRTLLFSRLYFILITIAVVSIPFTALLYFFITPLLLILWIIEGGWKNRWKRLKESKTGLIAGALILFWLINVAGLFHSNDLLCGLMRTYDKLPFLVFPLVFFTLNSAYFTPKKMLLLFKVFMGATTLMLLICWGNAFTNFFLTGKTYHFYYIYFSQYFGHPSYCALIVCIAFMISFQLWLNTTKTARSILSMLLLFFVVSIFFFQSRSGILALIAILMISLLYFLKTQKKGYVYGVIGTVILFLLIFFIAISSSSRMGNLTKKLTYEQFQTEKILGMRSNIWQITTRIAVENKMLGVGTGYKNESYLTEADMQYINKDRLFINAHNQYLQTFLEHGIVGIFVLFFLLLYSFYYAIKTKNYLLFTLLLSICINMVFESMLERNRGIFIFSLFYCLFIAKNIFLPPLVKEMRQE